MAEIALSTRKVMVVAQRPSDFVEMRRCAVALSRLGWRMQVLYFCQGPATPEEARLFADIDGLRREGVIADVELFGYIGEQSTHAPEVPQKSWRERTRLRRIAPPGTKRFLDRHPIIERTLNAGLNLIVQVLKFLYTVWGFFRNEKQIGAVLDRLRPDAIILPEDVVGTVTPLVIKAGHARNIPSLILPYTIANQQEAFRSLSMNPSYQFLLWPNRIIGSMFRKWVMRQDGLALVRLPAPYIVGQELTRTSPPDPWMMNSGFANLIAVENEAMLDYYRRSGIPPSKLRVVGAIYDDHLAGLKLRKPEELKALRAELGIPNEKPLLVVGGCPDQSMACPEGFEFADMAEFSVRLAQALRPMQDSYEVLVRPHPNYVEMADVMGREGLRATMVDTARLVALSDVYIAFASATIRWAIACAVPTLNYDVFHYDYDDYRGVEGVVHIDRFEGLCAILPGLRPGRPELARLQADIARSAGRWGRLDGQATHRIAALIDGQCRPGRVLRTTS